MSDAVYEMVYVVTYIFVTFCIARLFRLLENTEVGLLKEMLSYIIYDIVICTVYLVFRLPGIVFFVNVAGLFVLARMYQKNFKRNLLAVALIYFVMIAAESLGLIVCGYVPKEVWQTGNAAPEMGLVLQCIIMSILVQAFKKYKGLGQGESVPFHCWGSVLAVQCLLVYLVLSLASWLEKDALIRMTLLIIFLDFLVIYLYDRLLLSEQEKSKNLLLAEQNRGYEQELKLLLDSQKTVRGIYHDLKNHIFTLTTYLEQKEYDHMGSYLKRLQEETESGMPEVYTGHPAVDSMIHYKSGQAKMAGVAFCVETVVPEQFHMDDFDISVLLGNLLDNALEANAALQNGKKEIRLSMKILRNQLYLQVTNPFEGAIQWKGLLPVTQKGDKALHGLGMQNVKKIVNKYQGILSLEDKDCVFTAKMMLYLK